MESRRITFKWWARKIDSCMHERKKESETDWANECHQKPMLIVIVSVRPSRIHFFNVTRSICISFAFYRFCLFLFFFFCCPHIFFFIAVVAMFFLCRQFDVLFFIFLFVFGDLSLHRIGRHCIFFSDAKLRVSVYLFVILMCANFYYDAFHLNDIWVDSNRTNKTHLHLKMS